MTELSDTPAGEAGAGPARVPARRTLRLRRPGVAGRLLVAVLLPVTALSIAAGVLLSERYDTAAEARSIGTDIGVLTNIVRLRTLLDQEQIPAVSALRARELGFHVPSADSFGFASRSETPARAAVDAQLLRVSGAVPAQFTARLRSLRALIDQGRMHAREVGEGCRGLSESLTAAFAARLAGLERQTAGTRGAGALSASLRTLGEANDLLGAGTAEVGDVSNVYLDPPAAHVADVRALVAQTGLLRRAGGRLQSDAVEPVLAVFEKVRGASAWLGFQAAAEAAAGERAQPAAFAGLVPAGNPGGHPQLLALIGLFTAGIGDIHSLYHLVELSAADTSHLAAQLRSSATTDFRRLLIEAIVGIGLTVLVALLLARSISRPLRRLEDHARAVSGGNLELEPLPPRGPQETVVASQAFNELVCNLRLLESKARRLADGVFDDPELAEPLPGRLGEALQRSVGVLSNSILERERLQHRLVREATHDSLTGLHNRAAAVDFLDQAIERASRNSSALAVLFVDLDDFKRANDTHGHAVGDAILRDVARRMAAAARRGDFVGRVGGDEFVVIAEGVGDAAEAGAIAKRLIEHVRRPMQANGSYIGVNASVGIAFALDAAVDDSSQLLARADLALYRAKHASGSNVEIYDESLQRALVERAAVEHDLRDCLDAGGGGLFLHYQPVIDAVSGAPAFVEALVRWRRPARGLAQPGEFIPVAEASDLIIRLDRWVLAEALRQQREWGRTGVGAVAVAVNVSGRHLLSGQLVEHVSEALAATGADPRSLMLEITETVLLTDLPAIAVEMERLRGLGVRVAIDDFGTGYTSLAHLQHLTVDEIKIDRSFVGDSMRVRDGSLVRLVTDLGHHLGAAVVAEGVESEEQLVELRDAGCDLLQGYLIARPLSEGQLRDWLRDWLREALSQHA